MSKHSYKFLSKEESKKQSKKDTLNLFITIPSLFIILWTGLTLIFGEGITGLKPHFDFYTIIKSGVIIFCMYILSMIKRSVK